MLKNGNQDNILREDKSITLLYSIEKQISDDMIVFKDYTDTKMLIIKGDKIILTGLKKNELFVIFN